MSLVFRVLHLHTEQQEKRKKQENVPPSSSFASPKYAMVKSQGSCVILRTWVSSHAHAVKKFQPSLRCKNLYSDVARIRAHIDVRRYLICHWRDALVFCKVSYKNGCNDTFWCWPVICKVPRALVTLAVRCYCRNKIGTEPSLRVALFGEDRRWQVK